MFSLVNALYLRELPVREPGRLVAISPGWATQPFDDFRKAQQSFSGVLATGSLLGVVVATESGEQLMGTHGGIVSGNYFQVLGVKPEIGRLFTEDDDRIGNPRPVIVIGAPFWRRQFGGSPGALGRKIFLSGSPFTIIGVADERFTGEMPGRVRDFWVPLNMQTVASPQGDLRKNPGFPWLSSMGRLKPGISLAAAQAESQAVRDRLSSRPGKLQLEHAGTGFGGFRRSFGTQLQILAGIVGMVLLIVWTNVATLLLARGAARQREMAVRQALGCGRWRLVRQLLLEGLLLAVAGGAIGLALAPSFAQALVLMQPSFDVVQLDLTIDARLLAFGTAVSLLTAIAFSLAPALRASRVALQSRAGAGSRQRTIRSLVALQAAFSVMLVAVSLLFARSLLQLRAAESGYDRGHVIHTTLNLPLAGYRDGASQALLSKRLVERLSRLPGVKSASVSLCAALWGCSRMGTVGGHSIWMNPVSPSYFETMGMSIVKGRGFGPQDRAGSTPVTVVTEAVARAVFPGEEAVGKRLEAAEIIGVVHDIKFGTPRDPAIRMAFYPLDQSPGLFSYVQVKSVGSPDALVPAVRQAILEVDPKLFLLGPDPLSSTLNQILARETLLSRASTLFGVIALLLACFGVYGVISYLVVSRTAELGIRLAIGAKPGQVMGEVMGNALWTVLPGVAAGLAGAWAGGRFIESLLFGVTSHDPATLIAVAVALLGTTTLAASLPALRASRIDPLTALRCE
jgi:predicted permease